MSRLEPVRLSRATVVEGGFKSIGYQKALQHREKGLVRSVAAQDDDRLENGKVTSTLKDHAACADVGEPWVSFDTPPIPHAILKADQERVSNTSATPNFIDVPDEDAAPDLPATRHTRHAMQVE